MRCRGPQWAGSWSRWAADSTTFVVRTGAASARQGRGSCAPCHPARPERIETAGAGFRSVTERIDTTTAAGRMMMQMLGSFAEYERAMVKERTRAGLAAARAEVRVGGRRPKLTAQQRADIVENIRSGRRTAAQMARLYAVSQPTVSRILSAWRMPPPDDAAIARKRS